MQKEKRLPQSGKEGFIYGAVISSLTVLFMAILMAFTLPESLIEL